jgi:hypothetical protein
VPALLKVWEALPPLDRSGVLKLPSSAVALWGAWPVFLQVTVSPAATVTELGEKKKSPIVTVAEADACALPPALLNVTLGGLWAGADDPGSGAVSEPVATGTGSAGSVLGTFPGLGELGPVSTGSGCPLAGGSAGTPASCAAETAGTALTPARTRTALARALAPFIGFIV